MFVHTLRQMDACLAQVSLAGLDSLLMTTDTALAARSSGDPASPAADTSLVTHEDFTQIRCGVSMLSSAMHLVWHRQCITATCNSPKDSSTM